MPDYAWSNIYAGGEVESRSRANGQTFNVVVSRNMVKAGDKVSQKDLGDITDEEYEAMKESGSIREYPFPEGTDDYTSPHAAIMAQLVDDSGEVDTSKILEFGVQNPGLVAPAAEEAAPQARGARAETPKGA